MWPKWKFVDNVSTDTALNCRLLLKCSKYSLLLRDQFYRAFKATWRWGISLQLQHLRKLLCYRSTSVCLQLSGNPHRTRSSAGVSLQSSSDCDEHHLENVTGWFVSVSCVIRAIGFWSSDSKWSFHHLSSQSVAMYVLPRPEYWCTMLVVQFLMPKFGGQMPLKALKNKCILLQFTVQQQQFSPSRRHSPLEYSAEWERVFSVKAVRLAESVFSKCCEMYIYNIISWLYSRK